MLAVNVIRIACGQKPKFSHFHFSTKNYYIFILPFLLPIFLGNFQSMVLFAFFGFVGMLGESIFSLWWNTFYSNRFWDYKISTIFNKYSSNLNFVPWGIGGLLYTSLQGSFGFIWNPSYVLLITTTFILSVALYSVTRLSLKKRTFQVHKNVTLKNYLWFCFPCFASLALAVRLMGWQFLYLALAFGLGGIVIEFLFGKACSFFIGHRLWTYNYWSRDKGHITPLSFIPFALAGFYFSLAHYILAWVFPSFL